MIRIEVNPDIFQVGGFVLTWHGLLTFIAVALAVFLISRWAKREGIDPDVVYSTAVWAIIAGIIGARAVHVIDRWGDFYSRYPGQIIAIWNGGIAIYGAILGGFVGGAIYALFKRYPVGRLADISAPALLISMAVGRIGDIINGEHIGKTTTMPWGFVYSHPASPTNQVFSLQPTHPAVAYELLWDLAVLGMIWPLRGRLRPHGMLFLLYLALYSLGRFFISFVRIDKVWLAGLTQAQLIAIVLLAITVPIIAYRAQLVKASPVQRKEARPSRAKGG
jgi:phosphatidylglycerol:prolipoprotein diacylglycerol transferase